MFRLAVLSLLSSTASAFSGSIDPSSKQFRHLLKDAVLIEGRGLAQNNYQYQLNDAMVDLSITYTGCANTMSMMGNGQGGNNNNNNNNNQNSNGFMSGSVATFEIREGCGGPLVGKYATTLRMFTDGYTEAAMTEQEWRCETFIENNCGACEGVEDGGECFNYCIAGKYDESGYDVSVCSSYINAGQNGQNGQDFDVQRYLECGKMNQNNNNGNANANEDDAAAAYSAYPAFDGKFRIAPYCADDGSSIFLGVFYDQYCSVQATTKVYYNTYGEELPYSASSIVPKGHCDACEDPQQAGVVRELCSQSYAYSAKCENTTSAYVTTYGATTSHCNFVDKYIPAVRASSSDAASSGSSSGGGNGNAFAWIFAATTVLFAAYAFFLSKKVNRTSAALSSQDGGILA